MDREAGKCRREGIMHFQRRERRLMRRSSVPALCTCLRRPSDALIHLRRADTRDNFVWTPFKGRVRAGKLTNRRHLYRVTRVNSNEKFKLSDPRWADALRVLPGLSHLGDFNYPPPLCLFPQLTRHRDTPRNDFALSRPAGSAWKLMSPAGFYSMPQWITVRAKRPTELLVDYAALRTFHHEAQREMNKTLQWSLPRITLTASGNKFLQHEFPLERREFYSIRILYYATHSSIARTNRVWNI